MFVRLVKLGMQFCSNLFNPAISIFSRVENSTVSKKAKIWRFAYLNYSEVGDYSYVGPKARLIHAKIGKFCSIANETAIGMGTHPIEYISTSPIFFSPNNGTGHKWVKNRSFDEFKDVIIEHDVWVGARALVLGGVTIGTGAVIAAGAVVTKDVPPYAIVGGIPAKIIKFRFDAETIKQLLDSKWWCLPDNIIKTKVDLFQNLDIVNSSFSSLEKLED